MPKLKQRELTRKFYVGPEWRLRSQQKQPYDGLALKPKLKPAEEEDYTTPTFDELHKLYISTPRKFSLPRYN